jgi:hypothetical protein
MTLQRAKFLLLSRLNHVLLKLQSWVLAGLLKGYQRNNLTSSHLAVQVERLRNRHLRQPELLRHLLRSRTPRNNLSFSQIPHRGIQMSIQHLSSEEIEQAFAVVDAAWQAPEGAEVLVEVPDHLQHLSHEDWESVSRALYLLQHQKAVSNVH